jgi:hypothetical protein
MRNESHARTKYKRSGTYRTVCLCSMRCTFPVRRSQYRTLRSSEPHTTHLLSCDTAMEEILSYIQVHEYCHLKFIFLNKAISTERAKNTSTNSEQKKQDKHRRTRTICPKNSTVHAQRRCAGYTPWGHPDSLLSLEKLT